MKYYSLNHNAPEVSFKEAVIQGLASDKGLYFPQIITPLNPAFFNVIENLSHNEIAFDVIHQFVGDEIPEANLREIIADTLSFDFPVVEVEKDIYSLELFHGPTMAFKDVGARFMSRCLAYFNKDNKDSKNTVLVATSGDTGGAVASGFLGVAGVDVVILYPSGKVSNIQEKQLTTLGKNIKALEVDGVFDDCQDMVKKAFLDDSLAHKNLTSANSINIARWLPQMFYFFFAYKALKKLNKPLVFSCPSGNFGNICAGIMAKKLGLPIEHFVASTNVNDTVPRFLASGEYDPKPSKATISNAMDVGNPSNFIRIQELYNHDLKAIEKDFSSYSYNDEQTLEAVKNIYNTNGYIAEPHGAVGYLGLKKQLQKHDNAIGVFLETAHPIKFLDVVEPALGITLPIPTQIESVINEEKVSVKISNYEDLKAFLR
ncbi:threonine synthase [Flavobacterium sp. Fl-77]|uniref:Threonine synthase n=1 Tax=Flavobacterium flavipigmentatum TaxID=2893884 RepID=A0AAJ2S7M3_9FLAO|nr:MULTISPECIES: threonine synthase [unclassified Flavobacterium]MDX6181590.1 threonine synthase [Flavobacterium sp. Fl-33]MDX6185376.1 threonine synthase [Flavobacterium sp. Fl-77]UFH37479.1 threonine synthase [Flavobacterium sp. F-70]